MAYFTRNCWLEENHSFIFTENTVSRFTFMIYQTFVFPTRKSSCIGDTLLVCLIFNISSHCWQTADHSQSTAVTFWHAVHWPLHSDWHGLASIYHWYCVDAAGHEACAEHLTGFTHCAGRVWVAGLEKQLNLSSLRSVVWSFLLMHDSR